ncbi:MAG: STAS domain-containing protein [Bacteroidales bacterium]|nr:STAS domain-containing protein [Bacteroidales bacterium]
MNGKLKNTDKNTVLKTGSDLNIEVIKDLYKQLVELFKRNEPFVIKSPGIKNIDLTGIQFLYHAKKTGETNNTPVTFDLNFSEEVKQFLSKTGFSSLI